MSTLRTLNAFTILGGLTAAVLAITACASDESPASPSPAADAGPPEDSGAGDSSVPVETSCTAKSGTRLKLKWLVSADGTRVFDGMYDTSLASSCRFFSTSDGKTRCLPFSSTYTLRYLDDQCTQPVMQNFDSSFDACAVPKYIGGEDALENWCDVKTRAFEVGAKLPAGGSYFRKTEEGCIANFASTEDFYALTQVPDDTFVEAVRGSVKGPRFESETYEGVDGSRQCTGDIRDVTLGVSVAATTAADNKMRYLPFGAATRGFADSTCTSKAVALDPTTCSGEVPRYATEQSSDCKPVTTVHALGAEVATPFNEECSAMTPAPTPPWRSIGAAVEPTTFAEATTTRTGTGRLQSQDWTTGDGHRESLVTMFDTQLNTECLVTTRGAGTGATGSTRCLPAPDYASPFYRDADCTQPLFLILKEEGCAAGYPQPGAVALADMCEPRTVHVGGPWTASKYQKFGTNCSDVDFPGRVFFEGIDDIDQAQYAPLSVVIE